MVRITRIALFAFISLSCSGQEPKKPEIPKDTAIEYFKASAEQLQAQVALDQAQKLLDSRTQILQQIIAKITQACGDKFQPNKDQQGNLECVAKVVPVSAPAPKVK